MAGGAHISVLFDIVSSLKYVRYVVEVSLVDGPAVAEVEVFNAEPPRVFNVASSRMKGKSRCP